MSERVVIAGGSGFIGRALVRHLQEQGFDTVVLSRTGGEGRVVWDGETLGPWTEVLEGAAGLVNLSGKSISVRWTQENRREILRSRVLPTQLLGEAVRRTASPPRVWFNASAVGIYGDRRSQEIDEQSPIGRTGDFLVDTCVQWEAAVPRDLPSTRVVVGRIGFVLGKDGGAMPVLFRMARLGLTSPAGTGRQGVSWIHLEDAAAMIAWCLRAEVEGLLNVVGPTPCSNRELMAAVARCVGRPLLPPAPAAGIRLFGALTGTPADLVLRGQRAVPRKALASGFSFRHGDLEEAVRSCLP
ncbi:MAG: TIGR01777 family oxidoreductase [Fimbriimonadales bacterium]|nr:TIGR01777 family oxidoreductase [Fimbriimonadales bacterium]